jgi:signal transduction histidine kinase
MLVREVDQNKLELISDINKILTDIFPLFNDRINLIITLNKENKKEKYIGDKKYLIFAKDENKKLEKTLKTHTFTYEGSQVRIVYNGDENTLSEFNLVLRKFTGLESQKKNFISLSSINAEILNNTNKWELLQRIVDLAVIIGNYKVGYINLVENNHITAKTISQNLSSVRQSLKLLGKDFSSFSLEINPNNDLNLTMKSVRTGKIIIGDKFKDFVSPPVPKITADIGQRMVGVKYFCSIPIILSNNVVGTLCIASENEPNDEELLQLKSFSDQIGIAISISDLIENKEEQLQNISTKNHQLETIFKITNQIVTTLDPFEVASRAVNSVPEQLELIGAIVSRYDEDTKSHRLLALTDIVWESMFASAVKRSSSSPIKSKVKNIQVPFDPENFAIYDSLKEGLPILTDSNVYKDISKELGIEKVINVPLISRGRTLGVVSFLLNKKQFNRVQGSSSEYDLIQTFSSQLSIGLENARLFDQYLKLTDLLEEKNIELNAYAEKEKDILDIMGHELRTPIAIVRNSLSMMKSLIDSKQYDQAKLKEYLEIALKSARREIGIIETMLASSKIEGGKIHLVRTNVDPKELVEEALLGQEENYKKKNLQMIINIPDGLPNIFADRARSQEVIDNILSNAVKYTNEGTVKIDVSSDKNFVIFKISDTGIGIPNELLHKLGTKFFRVSQHINENVEDTRLYNVVRPGGTGLGLYVTFSLIDLHGGAVQVESKPGKGSTFTFSFPIFKNQKVETDENKSKDLLIEYRKKKSGDTLSDR